MRSIIIIISFIVVLNLSATIINIPADQPTIQEGINVSVDGDTILVADGVYTGNLNKYINWNGDEKHLIVKSVNGPDNCIIDAEDSGTVFDFYGTNQDSIDIIEGFTIKNANSSGIICYYASPTISNNIIINNTSNNGGGIYLYHSNAIIINNIIMQNLATPCIWPGWSFGGGIYISYGSPIVYNNKIINNSAYVNEIESSASDGGISAHHSNVLIKNNLISNNSGLSNGSYTIGGVNVSGNEFIPIIQNNTITDNSGTGLAVSVKGHILNNICTMNSGKGLYISNNFIGEIDNNNVWGNEQNYYNCPAGIGDTSWGTNNNGTASDSCYNICEDPLFVSNSNENYFLSQFDAGQNSQSPCVNAGYGLPIEFGLEEYTTRTDLIFDEGYVDIGFHYLGYEPQGSDEEVISIQNNFLNNYPNPFNPTTTIEFSIQNNSKVELTIYNIKGQKIKTLFHNEFAKGSHSIIWNGDDETGELVSSGVYLYKLNVNGKNKAVKKCLLLK